LENLKRNNIYGMGGLAVNEKTLRMAGFL